MGGEDALAGSDLPNVNMMEADRLEALFNPGHEIDDIDVVWRAFEECSYSLPDDRKHADGDR